jgi:hypothetical protein
MECHQEERPTLKTYTSHLVIDILPDAMYGGICPHIEGLKIVVIKK